MKSRGGAIRDTVRNRAAVPEHLYGKLLTSLLGGITYFQLLWFLFFFAFLLLLLLELKGHSSVLAHAKIYSDKIFLSKTMFCIF